MEAIRIGNDIITEWTVLREGKPENFENKKLSLFVTYSYGKPQEVKEFTVKDNVVTIPFLGKDQHNIGVYFYTLIENSGEPDMSTIDSVDAFKLVSRTSKEGGQPETGVKIHSVKLQSDINLMEDSNRIVRSDSIKLMKVLTQEEYDSMTEHLEDTLYIITGGI